MSPRFKTPIIYLCFNRPDLTQQTLRRIREINPEQVLVVCDGPRPQMSTDAPRVEEVRDIVQRTFEASRLLTRYQESNLGCRVNVSSGISWAFGHVDRAIILEDDCLPDLSFFRFCDELLEKYSSDERVAQISGSNLLSSERSLWRDYPYDYFFSRFPYIWGWATWARAWKHYDVTMKSWLELTPAQKADWGPMWSSSFERVAKRELDTWDYQWAYTIFSKGWTNITSSKNLVTNIGFRADATHTQTDAFGLGNKAIEEQFFPLRHPLRIRREEAYDRKISQILYGPGSWDPFASPIHKRLKSLRRLWSSKSRT